MKPRLRVLACAAFAATLAAACGKVESSRAPAADPATTQPGSAAEQSRGPKQGAAKADCGNGQDCVDGVCK